MNSRTLSRLFALIAVIAPLAACSSGERKLDVETGWLGRLSEFDRVSGKGAAGTFVRPTETKAPPLEAVFLRPIEITVGPGTNFSAIQPEDFEEIRGAFTLILRKELESVVRLSDKSGPGVYDLRIAFTSLRIDLANRRNLSPTRTDYRFSFADTALEAELLEGATNFRRAVAVVPAQESGRRSSGAANVTWTELPTRFVSIATTLRTEIAALKGAIGSLRQLPPAPKETDAAKKPAEKAPPAEKPKS